MEQTTPAQALLKATLNVARKGLIAVVIFSLSINLLMLGVPIYTMQIYDRVLSSRSTDTLILLTIIIVCALLVLAALDAIRSNIMNKIGIWIDRRLAGTVLTGSVTLSLKSGRDPSVQGLRDLNTFRSFLSGSEIYSFLDSPWAPIFILIVFIIHPYLGIVGLIGTFILLSLAVVNEYVTRTLVGEAAKANINSMQQAEFSVRNADVIEAMGMMPNLVGRWSRISSEGLNKQASAGYRSSMIIATSKFVRLVLQISILGTGAWLIILGELTPGGMIAAAILMGRALSPVERAISSWKSALAAKESYSRLKQHLAAMPARTESMTLPVPQGRISVEGLSYVHPGQTEPILKRISFTLDAGDCLGLIGPSASGKTTLVRLMLGNITPNIGKARLDGMDVARWDPDDLGQYCGYLPQDIELFSGTVKENIARMGEGDPELIVEAAIMAGCHDMILHLPNGYDTFIGVNGSGLSGGERQRIALARALYGNPRFVVLDEPNANLDALGEEALLNAVKKLKEKGITLVIIGHRPNVIQYADKIVVLRNGQMQDFGTRDDVLARLTEKARRANVTEIKRHV